MFLLWMAVFVVFSGLGGIASEGWLVIVARFVTGVAAGFMAPAGLSIITTSFPEGRERNRALLIYAGVAAAGFSLGMVVGGLLTAIGWRWVFFAPVRDGRRCCSSSRSASCRATTPRAPGQLRPRRRAGDHRGDDRARVHASSARRTSSSRSTLAGLAGSGALLTAFVRDRAPRAPSRSCASASCAPPSLLRANAGTMLFIGAFVAFQFVAVLYLQELRGWSPVETGLALVVLGIDAILAPTLTPKLVERFGKLPVIGAGTALAALGYALFLRLGADWTLLRHAADAAARRRRVRAHLRDADDRRHRRDRRARAGPRERPAVRLAAVRRRRRPGDRRRGQRRGHERDDARRRCSTATAPRCWSRWRWPRSRWP